MDAVRRLQQTGKIKSDPIKQLVAALSVGVSQGQAVVDLDYEEDSKADTDMNVVMAEHGGFIEIQGTAEQGTFQQAELDELLLLARSGINESINKQKTVLRNA